MIRSRSRIGCSPSPPSWAAVLLLITVVFDDILGGMLDGFGFDIGGMSITPILLGFIGMFGAGGLFATQVLDVHGAQAAIVGVVSGIGGAALAGRPVRRAQAERERRSRSRSPTSSATRCTSASACPRAATGPSSPRRRA